MAVRNKSRLTLDEFEAFIALPENVDKTFEYIHGEIVEVPSNAFASKIAAKILTYIGIFLLEHDLGHLTGEAGGYMVSGGRYAPDVAYISYDRQPELATSGYNPNPPELAVEVISDTANADEQRTLRLKLSGYLSAGVMVWIVNTETRTVEVHQVGKPAQELTENDTLTADDLLPDFALLVKDIFPPVKAD